MGDLPPSSPPPLPPSDPTVNIPCTCPVAEEFHKNRKIHTELLPLKAQDAYKLVFVHEKFMLDVHAARKSTNYVATAWAPDEETKLSKRVVTYQSPTPIANKFSSVSETQTLHSLARAGEVYVVTTEASNEGVPIADSFIILIHTCILRASPPSSPDEQLANVTDWCTYTCYATIKYKKTVWGIIKGQLERAAYAGIETLYRDVASTLRDHALGGRTSSAEGRTSRSLALQGRKKKRSKTLSSDFIKKLREEKNDWGHFIVNSTFLILTLLLVGININLFWKVQSLEVISGNLTNRPSCSSFSSLSTENQEETVLGSPHKLKAALKRLLATQQRSHTSDLVTLASHIAKATNALGQADAELHEVLVHLPGSLDATAKKKVGDDQIVNLITELLETPEGIPQRPIEKEIKAKLVTNT